MEAVEGRGHGVLDSHRVQPVGFVVVICLERVNSVKLRRRAGRKFGDCDLVALKAFTADNVERAKLRVERIAGTGGGASQLLEKTGAGEFTGEIVEIRAAARTPELDGDVISAVCGSVANPLLGGVVPVEYDLPTIGMECGHKLSGDRIRAAVDVDQIR